jgi:serine/threonine protein kinase
VAATNEREDAGIDEGLPSFGARFTNVTAITRGARSSTFRAQESEGGAWRFVKAISQARANDPKAVTSFLNEAALLRILAKGTASSCIVPLLEVHQSDPVPHFVAPFLEGWDLAQAMRRRAQFHVLSAVRLVEKCLEALVQIHGAGVVHGDLSPENIFLVTDAPLRRDGVLPEVFSLRLLDFESARRIEGSENGTGRPILGKAPYMAPELVKGSPLTMQSDLYAVGIVFYEMLVGRRPYSARTADEIRKLDANSFAPIPLALEVPQLLEEFLQSMIVLEPARRVGTAAKALHELRKLIDVFRCLSQPIQAIAQGEPDTDELREVAEYVEGRQRVTTTPHHPNVRPTERTFFPSEASPTDRVFLQSNATDESPFRRKEISTGTFCIPSSDNDQTQHVDFSAYAPDGVRPGSAFLLDVWAYLPLQRQEMMERASRRNRKVEAGSMGNVVLPSQQQLYLRLLLDNFTVENPTEPFGWSGQPTNVSFLVRAPADLSPDVYPGQVQILNGGMLISKLFFEVVVLSQVAAQAQPPIQHLHQHTERIRTAFASYSSRDRKKVLERVQGMAAAGVDVFLDLRSLEPGQNWDEELCRAIESRDVFYLFWSEHAKASRNVEREWRTALDKRGLPFIHPIPLENPADVPPPNELSSLHFNDIFLAILSASVAKETN